jgi:hypothetical protein
MENTPLLQSDLAAPIHLDHHGVNHKHSKHVPSLHKTVDAARNDVKRGNGETWKIWQELVTQAEERINEYQVRDITELHDRTQRNGEARWRFPTTNIQALEPGLNVHSIRENFQPYYRGSTG